MNPDEFTQTMKIVFSAMDARLRAFSRHGGTGRLIVQSLIRRGGVPSGAAAFIVTEE
jgi:hypothetical protein